MDPKTTPVSVTLERLKCNAQEDTEPPIIDTEDDEPYVLVLSVDGIGRALLPGLPVTVPSGTVYRVGPVEDIDEGDLKPWPANHLWGLGAGAQPMADPDRAFFVVTLLENDAAHPSEVEGQVKSIMIPSLVGHWSNALGRSDLSEPERFAFFVESVRSSFQSTVNTARKTGSIPGSAIDPDDLIGPAQVLRFSSDEQSKVLSDEVPSVERTLHCEGDDANYDLTFALRRSREARWNPPFRIAEAGSTVTGSAVAAVSQNPGHLDVFWIDPKGAVGSMWWDAGPGGAWKEHAPFLITPPGSAQPATGLATVAQRPGHLDVFWADPDGGVVTTWWDAGPDGAWDKHAPFRIAEKDWAVAGSAVAAVSQNPGHLDVFWIDPHGGVGSMWWDAGPGGAWNEHAPFLIAPARSAQPGHRAGGGDTATRTPGCVLDRAGWERHDHMVGRRTRRRVGQA